MRNTAITAIGMRRGKGVRRTGIVQRAPRFLFSIVLLFSLSLAFLVVLPNVCVGVIDWSLSADTPKRPSNLKLSPIDRGNVNTIWAEVIAGSYQVTIDFVNSLYDRRYDFDEIALMLEMAKASKKDPSEIAVLRRNGLGWGAIAQRLGIHPAAMGKAKGKDSLFKRYLLAQRLAGYYGIPDSEVLTLLNEKGYGFDEMAIAVNVCAQSGTPLRDVIAARATGAKWRIVAEKFKMSPAKLTTPPAEHAGEKAKVKSSAKATEDAGNKKGRSADCSKTCPRKCY